MNNILKQASKVFVIVAFIALAIPKEAKAHCEVPCGIFEDTVRIELLKEHITTIEKSMRLINELSAEGEKNYNQIVRWVMNKEEHAVKMQEIISQYFMHQRIKPVDNTNDHYNMYIDQLTKAHKVAVLAMKAKQSTDMEVIEKLRKAVNEFEEAYFGHKH